MTLLGSTNVFTFNSQTRYAPPFILNWTDSQTDNMLSPPLLKLDMESHYT